MNKKKTGKGRLTGMAEEETEKVKEKQQGQEKETEAVKDKTSERKKSGVDDNKSIEHEEKEKKSIGQDEKQKKSIGQDERKIRSYPRKGSEEKKARKGSAKKCK